MPQRRTDDGYALPVPVAGHAALELCNTRAGWGEARPKEYLVDFEHAVVLARELALIHGDAATAVLALATTERRAAQRELEALLQLRDDLYNVVAGPTKQQAVRRIDAAMAGAARRRRFTGVDANGVPEWTEAPLDLATIRHRWATAINDLLSSPAGTHIRACPGLHCGWLFTDPSGRRRWCRMEWCGNRAKARRHADRQRPQDSIS